MSKGMVRFIFNKLVRDRQSSAMQDPRIVMKARILNSSEFIIELKKKLIEEANEIMTASGDELIDELADLTEVLHTLMKACKITEEMVQSARQKKRDERGGFDKRIFVAYADIPRNSNAYDYCMRQPEKYPIKQK